MKPHLVVWFEIPVNDIERAKNFYESVFEVTLDVLEYGPLKVAVFQMGQDTEGSKGALIKTHESKPSRAGSVVYFATKNINDTLAKVTAYGGKILQSPLSIGEFDTIAQFEDTEGNRVGLYSAK